VQIKDPGRVLNFPNLKYKHNYTQHNYTKMKVLYWHRYIVQA